MMEIGSGGSKAQRKPRKKPQLAPRPPMAQVVSVEGSSEIHSGEVAVELPVDGGLTPNSVGANVRVTHFGKELARLHFAAIHVDWSRVELLRDAALASARTRKDLMTVDVGNLQSTFGGKVFPENFEKSFGQAFLDHFLPLQHEKFNSTGSVDAKRLPESIEEKYKLLVLSERLGAVLKYDLHDSLQRCLSESDPGSIVRASFEFDAPPPGTVQESILDLAIEELLSDIPARLDELNNLVQGSCTFQRGELACKLFRKATEKCLSLNPDALKDIKEGHMRETPLNLEGKEVDEVEEKAAEFAAVLRQGVVLHKVGFGAFGGLRIVRIDDDLLHWTKLRKKEIKSIQRQSIVAISAIESDSQQRTLRISTNKDGTITFRVADKIVRDGLVATLSRWWSANSLLSEKRGNLSRNMETLALMDASFMARQRQEAQKGHPKSPISAVKPDENAFPSPAENATNHERNLSVATVFKENLAEVHQFEDIPPPPSLSAPASSSSLKVRKRENMPNRSGML